VTKVWDPPVPVPVGRLALPRLLVGLINYGFTTNP